MYVLKGIAIAVVVFTLTMCVLLSMVYVVS